MASAEIKAKNWDDVQAKIRKCAERYGFTVSPESYLSLEDARGGSIYVFKEGAAISFIDFYPFLEKDAKTLKSIKVNYHENCGAEKFLECVKK